MAVLNPFKKFAALGSPAGGWLSKEPRCVLYDPSPLLFTAHPVVVGLRLPSIRLACRAV